MRCRPCVEISWWRSGDSYSGNYDLGSSLGLQDELTSLRLTHLCYYVLTILPIQKSKDLLKSNIFKRPRRTKGAEIHTPPWTSCTRTVDVTRSWAKEIVELFWGRTRRRPLFLFVSVDENTSFLAMRPAVAPIAVLGDDPQAHSLGSPPTLCYWPNH